jgi:hypothetical protein
MNLRRLAEGQSCVACGIKDGTVVAAHYFGPRRHAYGGGLGKKGSDAVMAHLCALCHRRMDSESRNKEKRWELSEEFLHYCALTWIRLIDQGLLK